MTQLKHVQLENGLRLVFRRLPYLNSVSINLRVNAGTRHETWESAGLAHLVEHLLFQGTHRWQSNYALTSQIEALGGEMWGATHMEYTSFWLNMPRNHFVQSLPIFLDMLRNPLFAPEHVEDEKRVILDELAELAEQGQQQVQFLLNEALWPAHPLGRPLLGRQETITSFGVEDVRTFFERYYLPDQMVAAVVGDIEPEEIVSAFNTAWGDWAARCLPITHQPPTNSARQRLLKQDQDSDLLHIMFGFEIPPLNHRDYSAHILLRTLLAEGMSSRLYTVLRGDAGLCYSIDSDVDELCHACVLNIYLVVQPSNVSEVFQRVCGVYRGLRDGQISREELEHIRGQAIGQLTMQADRVMSQARMLALSTFLTGEAIGIEEQIVLLEHVDLNDLHRIAREALRPANTHVALVGSLDEETWQRCRDMINGGT